MELKFITRTADTPPLGKPRVFFCASKHDFDIYFETMSKDILDILNCAIYYLDYEDNYKNDSELFELLDSMQLFVVPITSELLLEEANDIREYLLKHYIEQKQKIIIPIVVEEIDANKLALFEQYFGKIQFLDQTGLNDQAKGTQIPYKMKLETTLKNILAGDKLAQEIRDAFDIHIFLSYRKKDRKDAQKLMHLIHSDPTCEDLAIWYDEKLVPGESYDSQIANEMKNCDLFIFNVTESFLETGNYVVTTEYPTANNYGKPIIPVEMRSTDKDKLNEMFDGIIPKLITVDEHSKICPMTLESIKNIERNERINDAKHLFFLGLAYLNGIDVEVDEEHGKRLLLSAAEQGLPEAMEKLAHLAFDGKKDPNIADASCWQKRAVETYKEQLLQVLTDIDLFERFQEATEYLIQLYSCNNEVKGFSFCTETVEELAALYNKYVLEQPETYKDFFQKIQYLRIHAASHCDDIDQKRQIANDVEASYMDYFALSHNVENAGTLIDLLCTLSREMKTGLHFAYNKIESIKAKFCDLLSELVLCTMYVKVCRTFVDFEKVSPISPALNIKIDDNFMDNEFGWWRYAKEAYALCREHIKAAPEDLEWKKLYCESLYVLAVGATKVLGINSDSFIDQTLIDNCNHYADEYNPLYPDIMKLEDYDAKCSYIDAALKLAYWQYTLRPMAPDITNKAELTVVEKYKKALSLADHLCEEYQTRESLIYYWSKLNYCTKLCFLNDEANKFVQMIAEKSLILAQDMYQREHSLQTSIRLANTLESFFNVYGIDSDEKGIFEKLQEAISIYQELVNKGLSKEFHCEMETKLWELYETAYYYMGRKAQEEEAIKYLLSSTELSKKMLAEHNKLPGDFPLNRLGYLASSEYEHYNTTYDQVEKEVADFKEKITSEKIEKRLKENDFTSLLHMADDYFKKLKFDSALNLYKKLDGNTSITRYEKMFTCMKNLKLNSEMISIYPKVVEELKQNSSSSLPKAIAKLKSAESQFTVLKSRVNVEKELAVVYIDRKQFQEAKEHLLIAQTVCEQASQLPADAFSKHLLEVAYNKISKLLEQCEEHL